MRIKRGTWVRGCTGLVTGLACAAAGLWAVTATADATPSQQQQQQQQQRQRAVTTAPEETAVPHNMPGAVRGDGEDIIVSPGRIPDGCWVEIYQTGDVGPKGSYRQTVTVEVCQPPEQEAPADNKSKSVSGTLTMGGK